MSAQAGPITGAAFEARARSATERQITHIIEATRAFEQWLAEHTSVVRSQLKQKHKRIAESPFVFLRGTVYRWAQVWPKVCPDLVNSPRVLATGDLHVESFGTWRDLAGRLVWGIDDFDEACPLPYTQDLVRLAASARLATAEEHLKLNWKAACDAILEGYTACLRWEGQPFVLEEDHHWLRTIALNRLDDPRPFWMKLIDLPSAREKAPPDAQRGIEALLPEPQIRYRLAMRTAGVGSLGHRRFLALADWRGGRFALEAKALVPSAFHWTMPGDQGTPIYYERVLDKAVRARDPFVHLVKGWIVRRLAPDSSPIEISSLPRKRPEERLLHAMGWETANIHLATKRSVKAVQQDLRRRSAGWLRTSAREMSKSILKDWKDWKKNTE